MVLAKANHYPNIRLSFRNNDPKTLGFSALSHDKMMIDLCQHHVILYRFGQKVMENRQKINWVTGSIMYSVSNKY